MTFTGGDISLKTIIDKDGIIYKPIRNYYNHFCYFICCIHRLHSSKTLQSVLSDQSKRQQTDYSTDCDNILFLLTHYDENPDYESIIKSYFHSSMKQGGCPQMTLTMLFIPTIYELFGFDVVVNVMKEIGLTFKHFSNTRSISDFKFTANDEFNKKLYYNYMELLRKEKPIETESFKVGTLCLFFKDVYDRNTVSENAGHAITIIKDKDDVFYVIDDAHVIVRFEKYIEFIYESMYEIELKDIDDESLDKLIKQFDQREDKSTHHLHFNKRIYRVVIKPRKVVMSRNVSGGNVTEFEYKMTNDSVEEVLADRDLQIKAQRDVMEKTLRHNDRILKAIMLFGVIGFIVIVALSFIIKLYSNVDVRCSRSNC